MPPQRGTPGSRCQPQINGTERTNRRTGAGGSAARGGGNPPVLGAMVLRSRFGFAPQVLLYLYSFLPAKTACARPSWVSALEETGEARQEGSGGKAAPVQPAAHARAPRHLLARVHRGALLSDRAPNPHPRWLRYTSCAVQRRGRAPPGQRAASPNKYFIFSGLFNQPPDLNRFLRMFKPPGLAGSSGQEIARAAGGTSSPLRRLRRARRHAELGDARAQGAQREVTARSDVTAPRTHRKAPYIYIPGSALRIR